MNNWKPSQGKLVTSTTCFLMKVEAGVSAAQQWRKIYIDSSILSEVHDLNTSSVVMGNLRSSWRFKDL